MLSVVGAVAPSGASAARAAGGGADPARFVVQDATTNALLRFDGAGAGGAFVTLPAHTSGFAWGPDGNLYVRVPGAVLSYDGATGESTGSFVTDDFMGQAGPIAFGPDGDLFVADLESDVIDRYCGPTAPGCHAGAPQPSRGQERATFATAVAPRDMTFGPDGNLYLAGTGIERLNGLDGTYLGVFVAPGSGGLGEARSLAFGPDGELYVANAGGGVSGILRYGDGIQDPAQQDDGTPICDCALFIPAVGGVGVPTGLDFGPDGDLYVASEGSGSGREIFREHLVGRKHFSRAGNVSSWDDGAAGPGLLKFPHLATPRALLVIGDSHDSAQDGVAHVYDAASGRSIGPLYQQGFLPDVTPPLYHGPISSLVFGPDGLLYMAEIGAGDIAVCEPEPQLDLPGAPGVGCPAPDGTTGGGLAATPPGLYEARGVTFGPDGRMYVSLVGRAPAPPFPPAPPPDDMVAVVKPDGSMKAAVSIQKPGDLAFGPDGALYIANPQGIYRTPVPTVASADVSSVPAVTVASSDRILATGDGTTEPAFAFGPDGYLYVYGVPSPDAGILQVDVATGKSTNFVPPDRSGLTRSDVTRLVFGPDRNLYAATGGGAILRYDGATGTSRPAAGQPLGSAVFIPAGSGGLERPTSIAFAPAPIPDKGTVSVRVVDRSGSPIDATLVAEQVVPGTNLVTCPFAGLFFAPCPTPEPGTSTFELSPGQWVIKATPAPDNGLHTSVFDGAATVVVTSGQTTDVKVVLDAPEAVPSGTTVDPPAGAATPIRTVDGVPVLFWRESFGLTTHSCPRGSADYALAAADGSTLEAGGLAETEPGTYAASVPAPTVALPAAVPYSGLARVTINFHCNGVDQLPVTFLIYIDPSGTVVDDATGAAIAGATVTLMHAGSPNGPFTPIPAGSVLMALSNRSNPDTTDAAGRFGWDVAPGYYELRASAPGYTCEAGALSLGMRCVGDAVVTGVIAVPPAALDLVLPLHALSASSRPVPTGGTPPAAAPPVVPPLASAPARGAAPPLAHRPPRVSRTGHGPIRARRRATVWVISLEITIDEPATLRLRLLDSRGRPLRLAKDSVLGANRLRHQRWELIARCHTGRIRIAVRVSRAAGPGRLLRLVATDADGATTRASLQIVRG